MSILSPINPAPTASTVADKIRFLNSSAFMGLKSSLTQGFNLVWKNPDFTPQQVLDAFGTDAASLFNLSYQAQLLIQAIDPTWTIIVPPLPVTMNQDGTVTINATS